MFYLFNVIFLTNPMQFSSMGWLRLNFKARGGISPSNFDLSSEWFKTFSFFILYGSLRLFLWPDSKTRGEYLTCLI